MQTPARRLLQWAHLMTSVSSWDRTRRCPLDATAYTTASGHLARNAALLHFLSYREPFHLIPASCNSSLLPHSHATSKLDHVLALIRQRSSGKKLPCQRPSSSLSSQNAEVRRGHRSAFDLQGKARDAKPAVSERESHLTFLASYWVAESAISTDSVNSYLPSYLSTYLNFTTYLLQSTTYFCYIYALPTVLSITECAFWGTFYCLLVCH